MRHRTFYDYLIAKRRRERREPILIEPDLEPDKEKDKDKPNKEPKPKTASAYKPKRSRKKASATT